MGNDNSCYSDNISVYISYRVDTHSTRYNVSLHGCTGDSDPLYVTQARVFACSLQMGGGEAGM